MVVMGDLGFVRILTYNKFIVTLTHRQSNPGTKIFSITASMNISINSAIILLKECAKCTS